MISQAKIDLTVLLALFNHSEVDGEAETPSEIARLLEQKFSLRRVTIALEELASRNEVQREYHPHYSDEGLWQISRTGVATVEKALKIPASFIARLNANGLEWLDTDEAEKAVLSKLQRYLDEKPMIEESEVSKATPTHVDPFHTISVNVSPTFTNEVITAAPQSSSSDQATWFGSWGTWAGAVAAIAAIFVSLYQTGKF